MWAHFGSSAASFSSRGMTPAGSPVPSKPIILPSLSATGRMGVSAAVADPISKQAPMRATKVVRDVLKAPAPRPLSQREREIMDNKIGSRLRQSNRLQVQAVAGFDEQQGVRITQPVELFDPRELGDRFVG